ncbi:uncharacterized protein FA14DRAFT_63325 [Meira miltonrushii]|uniref:Uncharacterized protein n=1 Tax=Meira miltonrushii TaxID=1280837 RepID=A0A316VC57_9BASI|nr:uncharacterized protein FA14DRAFT_63325 [Meira miltonrushii]PWN33561.1 hypothetical protein FA14DRAFT_63325 [Meira miltonrushii]
MTPTYSRAFTTFAIYLIMTAAFGTGQNLQERAELPDLNDFPLEHGFAEHPAIHEQKPLEQGPDRKKRSPRPRVTRTKPISTVSKPTVTTSETNCEHSKSCEHWKNLSTQLKNRIRAKLWRDSLVSILAEIFDCQTNEMMTFLRTFSAGKSST